MTIIEVVGATCSAFESGLRGSARANVDGGSAVLLDAGPVELPNMPSKKPPDRCGRCRAPSKNCACADVVRENDRRHAGAIGRGQNGLLRGANAKAVFSTTMPITQDQSIGLMAAKSLPIRMGQ